jgi:hypothetical protein
MGPMIQIRLNRPRSRFNLIISVPFRLENRQRRSCRLLVPEAAVAVAVVSSPLQVGRRKSC